MRVRTVVSVLALTACASGPTAEDRVAESARIRALAAAPARSHHAVWDATAVLEHVPLDRDDPAAFVAKLAPMLSDPRAPVAAQAAFDIGSSGAESAAELIGKHLPADAPAGVVAAAATGLARCKSDATERVLVALALRPSHPPEALEALFSHYRWRGADKPAPAALPDAALLEFADHASPRGRAALAHLGRAVKDPALVEALIRLTRDSDVEVRRAAVLALADGPPTSPRPALDRDRCIGALAAHVDVAAPEDPRVVASACRAVASYDDASVATLLRIVLDNPDFNVRVAALEGLGKRKANVALESMMELARTDPSASVRFTAAVQLLEIDPVAAQPLADGLLADASEYVRSAGVQVLAKSEDLTANARLASIAKTDPHVRVRETAVGAFEGKKDSGIAKDSVRAALGDADVGVVSTACGVAAKNEWTDLADAVAAVPARFPGCLGADARESAIAALSNLDGAPHRALFESHLHDANPAVRAAAEKAVAKLGGGKDAPPPPTRGADVTGALLPGGAPVFDENVFLVVETDHGTMKIRLFPGEAPVHCAHVAALARSGFYDGLTWHRVVPDFVIQGGCPRGDGSGNAGVTLPLEPTRIPFERGTLGMPRSDHPDTGGCQLFICHSRAPHLDVHYTAFGKVVEGLDVIDKVDVDSRIVRVRVEGAR